MNPPATIEDLPPEMICELFKHLPLKDLLACSLVNKRWHSIFAGFKVDTLVMVVDEFDAYHLAHIDKWTYPNRRFGHHELCDAALFNRLADHPRSKHVKRLLCHEEKVNPVKLKSFSQLQHLEIVGGYYPDEITFSLSELEVLVFTYNNYRRLSIDCPKLRVLVFEEYGSENLLDVKHPETIRELRTNLIGGKLVPFKSVKCLVTTEFRAISRATLQSLPALKKLHFNADIKKAFQEFRPDEAGALDRMKRTLHEFLGHVQQLKRADFQFRFAGLELTETTLAQIDFDMKVKRGRETVCNESVYLKNFHLIEPGALHFIHELDYSRLMSNVTGDLPAGFFEKFTGVDEVSAEAAVRDEQHFGWFLESLRSCRTLWLDGSQLGRDFYKYHLPKLAPSLDNLIMSAYDPTGLLFDFKFLYDLPSLKEFSIVEKLSLAVIRSLAGFFEKLEAKVYFDYECEGRGVLVEKTRYHPVWEVYEEEHREHRERMFWHVQDFPELKNLFDWLEKYQTGQR